MIDLVIGAAASLPFAVLAARLGRISAYGAFTGVVCGAVIYAAFYLAGLAVLGAGLVVTIAASRVSASRRHPEAVREDDQRGAANIIANCGVGFLAAAAELIGLGLSSQVTALWCATAIAAGSSDTVASELGKAFGGHPRAFPTLQRVPPGTPGAISLAGTLSGAAAAMAIALPAAALWLLPWRALPLIAAACTVGAFAESALATHFEHRGLLGNHQLNVINTVVAAAVAVFNA